MTTKRTEADRVGITDVPESTTYSNPMTAQEQDELKAGLITSARSALRAFADCVASTEDVCRHIIEKAGGVRAGSHPITHGPRRVPVGHVWSAGYILRAPIAPYSEVWFALQVLDDIQQARACATAGKLDDAMAWAWTAGLRTQEAHMKFKWEALAIVGEKVKAGSDRGKSVKHDSSERKGFALAQKFQELEQTGECSAAWIYEKLALESGMTRAAVARKIQRHRAPLRSKPRRRS